VPSTRRATPCEKGAASFGRRLGGEHDRRLPAEVCQDDLATGLEGFQLGWRQLPGALLCGALDAYGQRVAAAVPLLVPASWGLEHVARAVDACGYHPLNPATIGCPMTAAMRIARTSVALSAHPPVRRRPPCKQSR